MNKDKTIMIKKISFLLIISFLLLAAKPKPIQIFMAGDSTMSDKPLTKTVTDSTTGATYEEAFLERGWGMLLPEYLDENVIVRNYAKNGRSTRTFIEQGWWDSIVTQLNAGDFVVIQFAHNDGAINKTDRYTSPEEYRNNLLRMISDVRSKGGKPILATSIVRRKFDKSETLVDTHGVYPTITREIANSEKLPLVDMQQLTAAWLQNEGKKKKKKYFHKIPSDGSSKLYPKGLDDNTHLNEDGARIVAGMFAKEIKRQKIKILANRIR